MPHNDIWHLNIQNGRIFGLEGDVFGINKEEVEFIIKDKGKDNYKYNTFGRLRGSYLHSNQSVLVGTCLYHV